MRGQSIIFVYIYAFGFQNFNKGLKLLTGCVTHSIIIKLSYKSSQGQAAQEDLYCKHKTVTASMYKINKIKKKTCLKEHKTRKVKTPICSNWILSREIRQTVSLHISIFIIQNSKKQQKKTTKEKHHQGIMQPFSESKTCFPNPRRFVSNFAPTNLQEKKQHGTLLFQLLLNQT